MAARPGASVLMALFLTSVGLHDTPRYAGHALKSMSGIPGPDTVGLSEAVALSEYHIRYQPRVGAYQSPNRAHGLRFTFFDDGFRMTPRTDENAWSAELRLRSVGRGAADARASEGAFSTARDRTTNGNRMVVSHDGVDIEYVNSRDGMRQNFVVRRKPAGTGLLTVALRCLGTLKPVLKNARDVLFVNRNGAGAPAGIVWYRDLRVWDASGRPLQARMTVEDGLLCMMVDDQDAAYPVTIDPISTTADWTVQGEETGGLFGRSIATA